MKYLFIAFLLCCIFSCTNANQESRDSAIQNEKDKLKQIVYLKDSTVNLCYAVLTDHFGDLQITCVPCDSVKNKIK